MLDGMVSEPNWKDPALSEELDGLKEENERLKKSLALLHAHSLRLQEQLDTLILYGTDAGGNSMTTHSLSESNLI
jgi:hypothetical protein